MTHTQTIAPRRPPSPRAWAGVAAALALSGALAAPVYAQESAVLVVIDRDSITSGQPPNAFTTQDINDELASVGMRDSLPFFRRNAGGTVTLGTGHAENPGWLTLTGVPAAWATSPGEDDGLSSYVVAAPGLGSPEDSGDRTRLLRGVAMRSVTLDDLYSLTSRLVCAVIYQGDVALDPAGVDLAGSTLGVAGFRIMNVTSGGDAFPTLDVQIVDAGEACQNDLTLLESPAS